jgi:hypothetical protein
VKVMMTARRIRTFRETVVVVVPAHYYWRGWDDVCGRSRLSSSRAVYVTGRVQLSTKQKGAETISSRNKHESGLNNIRVEKVMDFSWFIVKSEGEKHDAQLSSTQERYSKAVRRAR